VTVEEVLLASGTGTTREFGEVLELEEDATVAALRKAGARSLPGYGNHLWSLE
jgi:cytosine/adenosine deaminase-related metal-dependent hydrolase